MFRALKSFASGNLSSSAGDFSSDQIAKERADLAVFINMKPAAWDRVIEAAKAFAPKGIRRSSSRSNVAPGVGKRAVLREDSEDEDA